jgi:hypothetical protein
MEGEEGGGGVDWDSLAEAASGAVGALVSTTVLYPLDTCKTKFQADVQTDHGGHKYRSATASLPSLSLLPLDFLAELLVSAVHREIR